MEHVWLNYTTDKASTVKEVLTNNLNVSSRLLRKLKLNKRIFCNKKEAWVNMVLKPGDVVSVDITFEEENSSIISEKNELDILYEDNCLLVINKPAGIVVHPTCIHQNGTLANFVKWYLLEKGENITIRFVNRLDRETSGVIIFAKNEYTQESLSAQMSKNIFKKEYIAVVHGNVKNDSGIIDFPIKREEGSIMTRTISPDGEYALTKYKVIKRLDGMSVLKLNLETGRTHQIRVHMKAIGHPIVGDGLYSNIKTDIIDRQALHASSVCFVHPITMKEIKIRTDLPSDIKKIIGDIVATT